MTLFSPLKTYPIFTPGKIATILNSMKLTLIFLVLFVVAVTSFAQDGERVAAILRRIALLETTKNPKEVMSILDEIQSFDFWTMGGGFGPTDNANTTIGVLEFSRPFFAWDSAQGVPAEVAQLRAPPLSRWLRADASAEPAMLELLAHENPAARWIGVGKIAARGNPSPNLIQALESIAQFDGDLRIRREPLPPDESGKRRPFGQEDGNFFDAPLRKKAIAALAAAGRNAPTFDQNAVNHEGLVWLGKTYLTRQANAVDRLGLEGALRQLYPASPEILAAQAKADPRSSREDFLALFETLALTGGRGMVPPVPVDHSGTLQPHRR